MHKEYSFKNNRLVELDSLRGIATTLVLISHYTWAYDYHFNLMAEHNFHFPYGEMGVKLFFMISGFVIFMTIEKVKDIREFIIARFSRLYPTYWLCILITFLIIYLFPVPTLGNYSFFELCYNLTMIQGFFKVRHIDQVYWSLGVELIFYSIIGSLFVFKLLRKIEWFSLGWLSICLLSIMTNFPFENKIKILLILNDAPLFISGIMIYKFTKENSDLDKRKMYAIIIFLCYLVSLGNLYITSFDYRQYELNIWSYLLITIVYLTFLVSIFGSFSFFLNRILVFLGNISYPLYLLHNVIGYAIIYRIKQFYNNQFFYIVITSLICIGMAYFVSKYFEKQSNLYFKKNIKSLFKI